MPISKLKIQPNKAQVSLETTLALICVFIILIGSLRVFLWVNKRMVSRQVDYESTAVSAASTASPAEVPVDESQYPDIDIFSP